MSFYLLLSSIYFEQPVSGLLVEYLMNSMSYFVLCRGCTTVQHISKNSKTTKIIITFPW